MDIERRLCRIEKALSTGEALTAVYEQEFFVDKMSGGDLLACFGECKLLRMDPAMAPGEKSSIYLTKFIRSDAPPEKKASLRSNNMPLDIEESAPAVPDDITPPPGTFHNGGLW